MRNNELKVTEEFKNLFNNELVIYKNILIKGRSKMTFYNYIIVTKKGIFVIRNKTILGQIYANKYEVKWKTYVGFIPFIFNFYNELLNDNDYFSNEEVSKICERIEDKALIFSKL